MPDLLIARQWTDSKACKLRLACQACRENPAFRAAIASRYELPPAWPACPFGVRPAKPPATNPTASVCPHLVRNCCGQPSLCRLTGREVDAGDCQGCTCRPTRRPDSPFAEDTLQWWSGTDASL